MSFSSSAGGPIATAFVEVEVDLSDANRDVDDFLVRLRKKVDTAGELTGEDLQQAFEEAARQIDQALRDIGGAGIFIPVEAEAEAAGENIQNSFEEAQRQSDAALRDIGGAGAFTPVVVQAEVAGERIDNSFREAARQSNASLASIGKTSLLLVGGLAAALTVAGGAVVGFGVKSAGSLEQTQIGFESLLGSAEEAGDFIKDLQDFAANTPFEFQGLANNARNLLAVGEAAGITRDEILPTLTTIGDLTAVLGAPAESIDRVNRALAQMASKGKVSTEELLQLAEALPGFPVFQALADGLGISGAALQDQLRKGAIDAQTGIDALLKGMKEFPGAADAMEKQAQTLNGVLSTFKDTVSIALTDAFQPLIPRIKETLSEATPVIGQALQGIAPGLSTIAGSLITTLLDVFAGLAPGLSLILGGLGQAFEILGPTLGFVAEQLSVAFGPLVELFPVIAKALQPILSTLAQLAATILPPIIKIIQAAVTAFTPFLQVIGEVVQRLAAAFAPVLERIADIFLNLGDVVADFFESLFESGIIETFAEAFEKLAPILIEVAEIIGGALIEVFQKLAPSLGEIIELFADRFLVVVEALTPVLPELAQAAADIAIALTDLLVALLPLIIPLIEFQTLLIEKIGAPTLVLIAQAIALLATAFADLVTILLGSVGLAVDGVTTGFSFLWNDILVPLGAFIEAVFSPILKVLVAVAIGPLIIAVASANEVFDFLWKNVLVPFGNFLSAIFTPIVKGVSSAFSTVSNTLSTLAKPAVDAFKTAMGFLGDKINSVKTFISNLTTLMRDTFKPVVDTVKNAFGFFGDAVDSVSGFIESLIDLIGDAIDKVQDLINKAKSIPGVSALGGIIDALPGGQRGAIITEDGPWMLHAPEVVIPLNEPRRALALARESGLLDILAKQSTPSQDSVGSGRIAGGIAPVGAGITIGSLTVTLERGTASEANAAATAFVDAVQTTLQRRQIALTVRST